MPTVPTYPVVNRAILLLRPQGPYFAWLQSHGHDESADMDTAEWEPSVYLVPDMDSPLEEENWLRKQALALFAHELAQTPVPENHWPAPLTEALFHEWFKTEFVSGVFDMMKEPLGRG